ncbi:MAG: hypothetical protein HC802_14030 [Caldilineaceae bacterium]|nr:hypothetical protein [Caldilineaceae bacterium]
MATQPPIQRWWSRRWMALSDAPAGRQSEITPPSASRKSRIKRLEIQPALIQARVVDPERGECDVELAAPLLADEEWAEILDRIANQALISAQLLAGQVPSEIESIFAALNLALLPRPDQMVHRCSCCGAARCRHALDVYRAVGDLVDEDPWLLLQLRGRSRQQVADALREQRHNGQNGGATLSPADRTLDLPGLPPLPDDANRAPGLASDLDNYWGSVKSLENFHYRFTPPRAEFALLRRLGPPLFDPDGDVVHEAIGAVQRLVSKEALALAFAAEPVDLAEPTR